MQVVSHKSAADFLEIARDRLMENEAGNSILLSYAERQVRGVDMAMSTRFYSVMSDGELLLPAMFTPEVVPLLAEGPDEAAQLLARFFYPQSPNPTGVNGPKETALAFADEWEHLTHCDLEIQTNSRIYTCESVTNTELPSGNHRIATHDDFVLVKKWRSAFRDEVHAIVLADDELIRSQLGEGRVHLWEVGEPVSLALNGGETGNGGMVGAVYTPPEHRNNGYGTAVTSAVTRHILTSGKSYAVLYTDLDNPISNSIYQQIGYRPVMDTTLWRFKPAI